MHSADISKNPHPPLNVLKICAPSHAGPSGPLSVLRNRKPHDQPLIFLQKLAQNQNKQCPNFQSRSTPTFPRLDVMVHLGSVPAYGFRMVPLLSRPRKTSWNCVERISAFQTRLVQRTPAARVRSKSDGVRQRLLHCAVPVGGRRSPLALGGPLWNRTRQAAGPQVAALLS